MERRRVSQEEIIFNKFHGRFYLSLENKSNDENEHEVFSDLINLSLYEYEKYGVVVSMLKIGICEILWKLLARLKVDHSKASDASTFQVSHSQSSRPITVKLSSLSVAFLSLKYD